MYMYIHIYIYIYIHIIYICARFMRMMRPAITSSRLRSRRGGFYDSNNTKHNNDNDNYDTNNDIEHNNTNTNDSRGIATWGHTRTHTHMYIG